MVSAVKKRKSGSHRAAAAGKAFIRKHRLQQILEGSRERMTTVCVKKASGQ
jgi:hypothetical protein